MKFGRKMGPYRSFKRSVDKNDVETSSLKGLEKVEKIEPNNSTYGKESKKTEIDEKKEQKLEEE